MRVDGHVHIDAPPARVWELVGNPCTYPSFVAGVMRFQPQTDDVTRPGARFVTRMQVGSVPVGATVEVVERKEARDLAWTSITGIDHRGRWRLRPKGDGGTRVSFRLAYQSPGRLFGTIADRAAAPMVQRNVDETLLALKERIEGKAVERPSRHRPSDAIGTVIDAARVLRSIGILRPMRPDRMVEAISAVRRWGANPAAAVAASAARYPDEVAVVDDHGAVTYAELEARTNAVAAALAARDIGAGSSVGILAPNGRGFVELAIGASKVGADIVFLNTGFSEEQLRDVCEHEAIDVVLRSPDDLELLDDAPPPPPPAQMGRIVILTSGTTGRPKGAARSSNTDPEAALALLSRLPLRVRDTTVIAPPLFHAWGLTHLVVGLSLSATIVLSEKFDAEGVLHAIDEHRARVLVAVPVMLERLLRVDEDVRDRIDTSSLEVAAVSGSALSPSLASRFMDAFGDVIYNLYGSTEVAWATIADPQQLRTAPGTAGTPPRGTVVRILDEDGIELPRGQRGRIFVGNSMTFSGYTGGGGKEVLHGLVDSGDMGHFDAAGRLFVDGRSDDMIVSGGENVFPQEVEELLAQHPDVEEVAVIGVDDDEFGQRLAAFVVPSNGTSLDPDGLKRHVRDRLARYKVPREITVVDELPRNTTGKVLRKELATRFGAEKASH